MPELSACFQTMRTLDTTCKMCRCKVTVEVPEPGPGEFETLQDAVDRWLPLVTCNWCYDAWEKREKAGAEIASTCYTLSLTPQRKRTTDMMQRSRDILKCAGLAYAQAIAAQIRSTKVVWHGESAVDLLMAKPEAYSKILKEWREETRRLARNTNTEMEL